MFKPEKVFHSKTLLSANLYMAAAKAKVSEAKAAKAAGDVATLAARNSEAAQFADQAGALISKMISGMYDLCQA